MLDQYTLYFKIAGVVAVVLVLLYVRHVDGAGAIMVSTLDAAHVRAYPESYIQKPDCHPMEWIAADPCDECQENANTAHSRSCSRVDFLWTLLSIVRHMLMHMLVANHKQSDEQTNEKAKKD